MFTRAAKQRLDRVFPDDLYKRAHDLPTLYHGGTGVQAENTEEKLPGPWVVSSWVLRNVTEWRPVAFWLLQSIDKKMERKLQIEAHAARLLQCWERYSNAFPMAFAEEMCAVLDSLPEEEFTGPITVDCVSKHGQVALFLAHIFGAGEGGSSSSQVTMGSNEFWPSILEEIRWKHKHFRKRRRKRMLKMLSRLEGYITCKEECHGTRNSRRLTKAVKKLTAELSEAQKEAIEVREKIKMEAKRARLKASLSRPPWETKADETKTVCDRAWLG